MTNLSTSSILMEASNQWASRPADERFTSLHAMQDHFTFQRRQSRSLVVSNRAFTVAPYVANADGSQGEESSKALSIVSRDGNHFAPTNWSFGQLAQLAEAPAGYLRTLPSHVAADCINYGLQHKRDVEDVGLLLYRNGSSQLRAATGPKYGRIWNADILETLTDRFGDGVTGDWTVPGMFGVALDEVTKENTTLFAGDRDMFVFLADEKNRIEIPGRRNGQAGGMARGFFVWNSEVGSKTFGIKTFLFDYVCCNRIVWGADQVQTITMRHSAGAPDRWLEELRPALKAYGEASTASVVELIESAKSKRIDDVDAFLAARFGKRQVETIKAVHMLEEQKPIETLWDATTAVTAAAKAIQYQDARVELEEKGGEILALAK